MSSHHLYHILLVVDTGEHGCVLKLKSSFKNRLTWEEIMSKLKHLLTGSVAVYILQQASILQV